MTEAFCSAVPPAIHPTNTERDACAKRRQPADRPRHCQRRWHPSSTWRRGRRSRCSFLRWSLNAHRRPCCTRPMAASTCHRHPQSKVLCEPSLLSAAVWPTPHCRRARLQITVAITDACVVVVGRFPASRRPAVRTAVLPTPSTAQRLTPIVRSGWTDQASAMPGHRRPRCFTSRTCVSATSPTAVFRRSEWSDRPRHLHQSGNIGKSSSCDPAVWG